MTSKEKKILLAGLGVSAFLLMAARSRGSYRSTFYDLLNRWEGFRSSPYWDVNRYSWGFGTRAPGSTGTITREQALADAFQYAENDRIQLEAKIKTVLSPHQWAALLSFSYNTGIGNAVKLLTNINSENYSALRNQWLSYYYADGVPNSTLKARRQAEWNLFMD